MKRKKHPPFSVIIPTLWRPNTFIQLLQQLDASNDVMEVVVIDNARDKRPALPELEKLRLSDQGENLYVNPSWNLGVSLAKSTAVCLCNDDVLIADNLLRFMRTQSLRRITGLDPWSYSQPIDDPPTPKVKRGAAIKHNWGSVLFFERSRYKPIPSALKIWWGDAWLAQEMGSPQMVQTAVETKHSESAGSPEFDTITKADTGLWRNKFSRGPSTLQRLARLVRRALRKLNISHRV